MSDLEPEQNTPAGNSDPVPAERRNPALIATAVALPVALVIGIVVAAVFAGRNPAKEPVSLGPVPAPASGSAECATLMAGLPDALGDYTRAELTEPAPEATAAWQPAEGEPLVLRCGLDRPAEFDQASALQVIDGVQWFEISGASAGIDASSYFAVDRGVYIGLTVPTGVGPTPLQDISGAVSQALPQKPLDPAPVANP
jgi:hypothetical protein